MGFFKSLFNRDSKPGKPQFGVVTCRWFCFGRSGSGVESEAIDEQPDSHVSGISLKLSLLEPDLLTIHFRLLALLQAPYPGPQASSSNAQDLASSYGLLWTAS